MMLLMMMLISLVIDTRADTRMTINEYWLQEYGSCGYGTTSCTCTSLGQSSKAINTSLVKPSALNVEAINNCDNAYGLLLRGEHTYVDNGFRITDSIDVFQNLDLGKFASFHLTGMGYGGPIPDLSSLADPNANNPYTSFTDGLIKFIASLDLSGNRFTGTLPAWMFEYHFWSLSLRDNLLSGDIDLLPPPHEMSFYVCFFGCSWWGPFPATYNLERNKFSGLNSNLWSEEVYNGSLKDPNMVRNTNYRLDLLRLNLMGNGDNSTELFRLESGSFRGLKADNIILTQLQIPKIPSFLFGPEGTSGGTLSLRSKGINEVEPHAFSNVSNLQVHMSGNFITTLSPNAFPRGAILGSTCEDLVLWRVAKTNYYGEPEYERDFYDCSTLSVLNGNQCSNGQTCVQSMLGIRGAADRSASEACCEYGGGNRFGEGLLMDSFSPIYCHSRNETSDEVSCRCTIGESRYHINTSQCIQSCNAGEYWVSESLDSMTTQSGRCLSCDVGSISSGSESFPTSCTKCERGTFSSVASSSSCTPCPVNEYSLEGSVSCSECPFGKSSFSGDAKCKACDVVFMGSNHCETPYGGAAIGSVLIVIALLIMCCIQRYRSKTKKMIAETRTLMQTQLEDIELLSHGWIIKAEEVTFVKQIARGGYGEVWRGVLRDTYDVAIKKMFQVTVAKKDLETDSEIRFLQRARHPRLVMFLGCGYMDERKENIFLVLEFCDAGDYGTYLHHAEKERPWSERLLILQDVSEGIEYLHLVLHSIHRDLKSENILLRHEKRTNMLRAKIADFGLSKLRKNMYEKENLTPKEDKKMQDMSSQMSSNLFSSTNSTMTSGVGTPIYMAPEIARYTKFGKEIQYSAKIDVYSFAIIMWETLERTLPWKSCKFSHQVLDAVVRGDRPIVQSRSLYNAPKNYVSLMKSSWSQDPNQRPSFDKIHLQLKDIRTEFYRSESRGSFEKHKEDAYPSPSRPKPRPKPRPRPRTKSKKKAPPPPPPSSRRKADVGRGDAIGIGLGFDDDDKAISLYPV